MHPHTGTRNMRKRQGRKRLRRRAPAGTIACPPYLPERGLCFHPSTCLSLLPCVERSLHVIDKDLPKHILRRFSDGIPSVSMMTLFLDKTHLSLQEELLLPVPLCDPHATVVDLDVADFVLPRIRHLQGGEGRRTRASNHHRRCAIDHEERMSPSASCAVKTGDRWQ